MPGFDGTGPMGAGPMTGGGRGYCNPAFAGTRYPYGRGPGYGRGFGRGAGPGFGRGMGYGRGFAWRAPYRAWGGFYPAPYGYPYPMDASGEVDMLKAEAERMKNALDDIHRRIEEMENTTAEAE